MEVLESYTQELQVQQPETSDHLIKKIAKGGGIAFTGNFIDKGIRFFLQVLLGRVLGASGYGLYSLGNSLMMIGSQISMLGLQSGVVRFVALYKGVGDIKRVKGTLIVVFIISVFSSIVAGSLLFLFSKLISETFDMPELVNVLRIFAFALPFYVIMTVAGCSSRAFQLMKYDVAVKNVFHPMANIVIVSVIFALGFRLLGVIYVFLVSSVISAFLGLYLLKRIFPEIISASKPLYESWKILRYSVPVLFAGFSYIILGQTDRIMLGYFKGPEDLGVYAAAINIANQASLVVYSFSCIFNPVISDLYNRNKIEELEKLFKTVTRWIVSLTLPILIVFVVFSKQIMGIFGPEFVSSWLVLVVFGFADLIVYSLGTALAGYMLPMLGKQDIELVNMIFMVVLNIVLNFWLIQIYGILGAAIATGLSIVIVEIAKIVEVYKLIGIQPYDKKYYKPFVASLGSVLFFIFLYILKIPGLFWILNLVMFFVIYFLILYSLGLEDEDVIVLRAVRKRLTLTRR